MTRPLVLDDGVVQDWLAAHPPWRRDEGRLVRDVHTRCYAHCVDLVVAQARVADALEHHPSITIGYCTIRVETWTHQPLGLTSLDLAYAAAFEDLVTGLGENVVQP